MVLKNLKLFILTTLLTVSLGLASFGPAYAKMGPKPKGQWMAGDFHQHTYLTDGSNPMPVVFQNANNYGLHWWANSEHGGARSRDTYGNYLDQLSPTPTFLGDYAGLDGTHQNMWRWQGLLQYSYPVLDALRSTYPKKTIIQGVEWNVPGHEHCSAGIVDVSSDPATHLPVAQFEYLFDASDKDLTGGKADPYNFDPDNIKTNANDHAKAVSAVQWLQKHYGQKSWTVFAHIERKKAYTINHFRDFNEAGPDVAFGFEGLPGHQKESDRGSFGTGADGGGTYGGAGIYVAQTGGLWDALLSEGRRWFTFVSSDFHATDGDFWPGEYAKTWTFVLDEDGNGKYSAQEIADALRSGNSFCVHGDLINALNFQVQQHDEAATMGQTLEAQAEKNIKITIKFKSPAGNNHGDTPKVDHIDLIAGTITGKISPTLPDATPNPAYSEVKSDAKVIARFFKGDWVADKDGWNVIQYHLKKDLKAGKDMYFRIRGTNQDITGEINTLTDNWDPALDVPGENTEAKAWADLWFYSNPIYVSVNGKTHKERHCGHQGPDGSNR